MRTLRATLKEAAMVCVPLLILGSMISSQAQAPAAAPATSYKIISDRQILIQPPDGCVPSPGCDLRLDSLVRLDLNGAPPGISVSTDASIIPNTGWWKITFPAASFTSGGKYLISYKEVIAAKDKPQSFSVDTSAPATVTYESRQSQTKLFRVEWNVALAGNNGVLIAPPIRSCSASERDLGDPAKWQSITLTDKPKTGTLKAWHQQPQPANLDNLAPEGLGVVYLCVDVPLWMQNFTLDQLSDTMIVAGLSQVLRNPASGAASAPIIAPDTQIGSPTPPASKDDASFYVNLNVAAGVGESLAWGIDGKIAQLKEPVAHGYLTILSATANTGHNPSSIKGQTYTDTIDWTLPYTWAHLFSGTDRWLVLLNAGPTYETDIGFDRRNFLFTGDSAWTLSKLYQPESYRTKSNGKGTLPKYGDKGFAKYGYELEFHGGLETGGALIDTVQKATSGNAKITVPTYSIARIVPQVHGLFQGTIGSLGLLSFDSTITGRYLVATENTVRQSKTNTLSLRPIDGWKAVNSLVATWNPPRNGNVGITATYKDGFDAPKFSRVNSVLIGVVIKY
jgi:hypothetical protein